MVGQLKTTSTSIGHFIAGLKNGAATFFAGIAAFNNFLLLSLAYFFGIGLSKVCLFVYGIITRNRTPNKPETYWSEIHLGAEPSDSYYRPF